MHFGHRGREPAPKLAEPSAAPAGWQSRSPGTTDYPGPAILKWSGTLDVDVATAPVFRYAEPAANAADQFAAALGATLVSRPAGFLGDYQTSTLDIRVTGSIQSPPREPAWVISPIETLPPGDAAGGPAQVALVFLAEHSLAPSWPYETDAGGTPELAVVRFLRQFAVTGYGNASLVDETGARYGMEVDVTSGHPSFAAGPLSLAMDQASYNLISESQALQGGLAMSAPPATPGAPTVVLTTGELVYGLVVAGDQSYYEPEFMFSGAYVVDGKTYVKHVLVPAVDPSQSR